MDTLCGNVFPRTWLRQHQYWHIALRQFVDDGFHGAHGGADALDDGFLEFSAMLEQVTGVTFMESWSRFCVAHPLSLAYSEISPGCFVAAMSHLVQTEISMAPQNSIQLRLSQSWQLGVLGVMAVW